MLSGEKAIGWRCCFEAEARVDGLSLFSVVMPVYDTALYLPRAIESVLQQTFTDFELILIEDHSSDESFSVCQRYAAVDKRIRLERTEKNRGVSMERTKTLSLVRGVYCTFVASDDWIGKDLLAEVYRLFLHQDGLPNVVSCTV